MNKKQLISKLMLREHIEGGYFVETYQSKRQISTTREGGIRPILTSIFYMLTDDRPIGYFHRNRSDILHYFQAGSPITYLLISPEGELSKQRLGLDFSSGDRAQLLVPGSYWKASVLEKGEFGLLGEAVAPGFDYRDMEIADADGLRGAFPELWPQIAPYIKPAAK